MKIHGYILGDLPLSNLPFSDNAIKDILLRMDESDLRIETAGEMRLLSAGILEQLIASTGVYTQLRAIK